MKALVTGASGFIGRHIVENLISKGYQVRALVRRTSNVSALKAKGIELVYGDLNDPESIKQACAGVNIVFHTAAQVGDWGSRRQFYERNVIGTKNVLVAMLSAKVKRLVYLSSVAVYGRPRFRETIRIAEDFPGRKNGDAYCDTKLEAEVLVKRLAQENQIAVTILRPCIVYGPYDYKFIPRIAQNILRGTMVLVGAGLHRAPIVYVGDVANLSVLAAEREEAIGQTFNLASDQVVTWKAFLTDLAIHLGAPPPSINLPFPVAYYAAALMEFFSKATGSKSPPLITRFAATLLGGRWEYDITKAKQVLGFRPQIDYDEGLKLTVDWMREDQKLHVAGGRQSQKIPF